MAIKYGTIGYKYYKDTNGRLYGLRNYWVCKTDTRDGTLSIRVRNDAVEGEWYDFNDFDYYGYGNKYMTRKAEEKALDLNMRDRCVIPCTVG